MNQPWVHMCPTILNPILPAPHPIPLGCPGARALNALLHASNLHWSSISHKVIYMIQCYSLKSSYPHLLPHSPKVCSLHLWLLLFCCLTYRLIVTDFLNSISSVQFRRSSCPALCDLMDCSMPGQHVHLPEFTQTHMPWVSDAIEPSHPLSSPFPPTFNLSQYQGLFKWVSSSHQETKVLEFQLQHQFFQWIFRTDFL